MYVDNDPIVLTHARTLLVSTPEGASDYIEADLRDTGTVLREAARLLDLSKPVGLTLMAVLQYVPDTGDPHALVGRYLEALAPGSCLALSHPASDIADEEVAASMRIYNERASAHSAASPRTRSEVTRFFDGTELLDPGMVPLPQWRPAPGVSDTATVPMWCGVGRKP